MTPAARVQAAINCLDQIISAARDGGAAADTLIQRYFSTRRYAGSKDRRAVRELIYGVVRAIGELPVSGRAAMLGYVRTVDPALMELFDGAGPHVPPAVVPGEPEAAPGLYPVWLMEQFIERFGDNIEREISALLSRAPLDLRVNTLKVDRATVEAELGDVEPIALVPHGLRATGELNVEALPAYRDGRVEVQDAGSQFVSLACEARPGMTVVDLCAGAGGKTLALAAEMANDGRLIACDTDRTRLRQLDPRAVRAGVTMIETRLLNPRREIEALGDLAGAADLVLVDAPCSGTGTWRRNPEARWRLTPDRLARLVEEQARLLDLATTLVGPGGRLIYVVCSVLPAEGEAQIQGLLERFPAWQPCPIRGFSHDTPVFKVVLTPEEHGCDGFYLGGATRLC